MTDLAIYRSNFLYFNNIIISNTVIGYKMIRCSLFTRFIFHSKIESASKTTHGTNKIRIFDKIYGKFEKTATKYIKFTHIFSPCMLPTNNINDGVPLSIKVGLMRQ